MNIEIFDLSKLVSSRLKPESESNDIFFICEKRYLIPWFNTPEGFYWKDGHSYHGDLSNNYFYKLSKIFTIR